MDWSAAVDLYCERRDATFWAEPLNAVSNAAFVIAAVAAVLAWRRMGGRDPALVLLVAVVVMVGFGSFTFHTIATRGAMLADVIPIAIFIYGYLLLALRQFVRLSVAAAITCVILFGAGSQGLAATLPPAFLNGSASYLPALVAMIGVAFAVPTPPRRELLTAAAIFALSLTLRTVDLTACNPWPYGTHFLWHLLNAVVLYVLLQAAIRQRGERNA